LNQSRQLVQTAPRHGGTIEANPYLVSAPHRRMFNCAQVRDRVVDELLNLRGTLWSY